MTNWREIVLKAGDLADAATRKVNDTADLTKKKLKITENERAIRVALEALGALVYESRKEGVDVHEELAAELMAQVDELTEANIRLQAEIDNRRGCKTCQCGAKNPETATFCNACGKML